MQTIPTSVWTKLGGHDVEILHGVGHTVEVTVKDGVLTTYPPRTPHLLRPAKGALILPWTPPFAGDWVFETGDEFIPEVGGYLTPQQRVLRVFPSFEVAMSSGAALSFPESALTVGLPYESGS